MNFKKENPASLLYDIYHLLLNSTQQGFQPVLAANDAYRKTGQYTERKAILQAMFAGLYFDAKNQLRKVAAHNPIDGDSD